MRFGAVQFFAARAVSHDRRSRSDRPTARCCTVRRFPATDRTSHYRIASSAGARCLAHVNEVTRFGRLGDWARRRSGCSDRRRRDSYPRLCMLGTSLSQATAPTIASMKYNDGGGLVAPHRERPKRRSRRASFPRESLLNATARRHERSGHRIPLRSTTTPTVHPFGVWDSCC